MYISRFSHARVHRSYHRDFITLKARTYLLWSTNMGEFGKGNYDAYHIKDGERG